MVNDYELELPIFRGAVWNNPRGAVVGGLMGAAAGAGFAAAASGPFTALLMAAAAGWVSAYGGAIIEESLDASGGRVFPGIHAAWVSLRWHAYDLLAAWRRTTRAVSAALEQIRLGGGHQGQAGSPA